MLSKFLDAYNIKRVLEIGTANGGTAMFWANMVGKDGEVYTVDIGSVEKCYRQTEFEKQIVELVGDSHEKSFQQEIINAVKDPVDMLFIDGDHSYEGVKDDFNSFYTLVRENGFIVFHDIVDSDYHRERGCFVAKLWEEIEEKYETFEFIEKRNLPEVNTHIESMGIGVIKKTEVAVIPIIERKVRLNLGCGDWLLNDFINCDLYNLKADKQFDARKLPFDDESVDEIYACHLIEHFNFHEAFDVLKEWKRALKPGGLLRIETPDMLKSCKAFVEADEQGRISLYSHFFSEPWIDGQLHKFLYTWQQMKWALDLIGFKDIIQVPALRYIGREYICLGVECKK